MIARNELAYGNWVRVMGIYVHITDIGTWGVYFDYDGSYNEELNESFENIQPIPITEELLLEIGFKKEQDETFSGDYDYTMCIGECFIRINIYSNTINRDWNIHIDNNVHDTILSADIQYVHQLQNAVYFATDKEINIKL